MAEEQNEQNGNARRERRIERRQEEILQAAAGVFASKGYAQATIKEIAAAADVAEGSLYNYFPSKRDILIAIISRNPTPADSLLSSDAVVDREGFIQLIVRALSTPAPEQPWMRTIIKEAWSDDELFRQYQASHVSESVDRIARLIRHGVEAGWLRPLDPDYAARVVIGTLMVSMMPPLRAIRHEDCPQDREKTARTTADLLLYGLMKSEDTPEQKGERHA
jgi:AcrR family transcriptional regulator